MAVRYNWGGHINQVVREPRGEAWIRGREVFERQQASSLPGITTQEMGH